MKKIRYIKDSIYDSLLQRKKFTFLHNLSQFKMIMDKYNVIIYKDKSPKFYKKNIYINNMYWDTKNYKNHETGLIGLLENMYSRSYIAEYEKLKYYTFLDIINNIFLFGEYHFETKIVHILDVINNKNECEFDINEILTTLSEYIESEYTQNENYQNEFFDKKKYIKNISDYYIDFNGFNIDIKNLNLSDIQTIESIEIN